MSELSAPDIGAQIDAMIADPNDWVRAFLEAWPKYYFSAHPTCKAVGIAHRRFTCRLRDDPVFAACYAEAQEQARDLVRQELMRRALEPTARPVYHKGELVDTILEYDNRHLEWLAERLMPEEYHLPMIVQFAAPDNADFHFRMGESDKPLELPAGSVQDSDDQAD